jgi:hypothetical protein
VRPGRIDTVEQRGERILLKRLCRKENAATEGKHDPALQERELRVSDRAARGANRDGERARKRTRDRDREREKEKRDRERQLLRTLCMELRFGWLVSCFNSCA